MKVLCDEMSRLSQINQLVGPYKFAELLGNAYLQYQTRVIVANGFNIVGYTLKTSVSLRMLFSYLKKPLLKLNQFKVLMYIFNSLPLPLFRLSIILSSSSHANI